MFIYNVDTSELYRKFNFLKCFLENHDPKLLNRLLKKNLEKLETIKDIDFLLLSIESDRFLVHLIYFQKNLKFEWVPYYEQILKYFHKNNLLLFKEKITYYKDYHVKRPYKKVEFKCYDLSFKHNYHFRYELIEDIGRAYAEMDEHEILYV